MDETKTLNDLYRKFCRPKYEKYEKIYDDITLIHDFFDNFDEAKEFFISREKWKCIPYQGHSKPGFESFFPKWVGKSLLEKYILDNKISEDINSYELVCNFFYDQKNEFFSLAGSNLFPHVDDTGINDFVMYICLINLSKVPVFTKFYTYKNKDYCYTEIEDEWNKYTESIQKELIKFYEEKDIKRHNVKKFLDKKKDLKIKLIKKVEYKPNQAIIYPGNMFHCPEITEEFTENNFRSLLRISFVAKKSSMKNISYE